jgi:Tol biopolymer transport system component
VTNRYLYAAIQPDFSIELIREDGSSLIATLEDKNWSSISVSPEGAFVAMLGAESFESPTNIYMYDISKQEVRQLTNLAADAPSVREYRWISPTEIGFSQGRAPDNWFHRIDVEAGSTTKLFRADASFKLFNIAESRATYLFPDGSRQVFNLDGTKVESEEMVEQVNLFSITCIVDAKNITGYSFNEEAGALSFFSYNISGIQREIETFFVDSNAQIIPQNNSCNKDGDFLVKINEINSSNPDFYLLDNQVGSATRLDVEKLERLIGIALF